MTSKVERLYCGSKSASSRGWVETRYSTRGTPYQVWVEAVPRISDDMLDCCLYLYPSEAEAKIGEGIGGSGFLVGVQCLAPELKNSHFLYAVTNRHVVEDGNSTIRLNTKDGKTDIFELDDRNWHFHPDGDDLAIYGLSALNADLHQYKFLTPEDHFITDEVINDLNIGPGDETYVVGRFVNQDGKQRNIPSVRFGNLAQMPPQIIKQQRGAKTIDQLSFVVEAKSIGGYSGSPVFLGINPLYFRPAREKKTSNRQYLLGVGWGYITDRHPVLNTLGQPIQGMFVRANTGMMAVVPAWKLRELLELPAWKAHRAKEEAKALEQMAKNPAVTTGVTRVPEGANPNHKEDFTALLGAAARKQK